ncbi:MAG: S1 RNA-binding domain-containing protein [Peptococcaceae bacterium]|jgi:S1 RNA binding domain protein|nr:S1 RNA-binding domain-containing protein [Peptococcaceae bacterium]
MAIEVGAVVEGVVSGITNFGAFVSLPGGGTGLVHISEVADAYVKDVKDYLKEHDKVKVKVINVDPKGKIGLSIKQVKAAENSAVRQPPPPPRTFVRKDRAPARSGFVAPVRSAGPETFEDKLSRFIKESEQKQLEFRRSTDAKRGGRGTGRN